MKKLLCFLILLLSVNAHALNMSNGASNLRVLDEEVGVQNPLPADSDSVYVKDLDLARCDNGNFQAVPTSGATGSVADYFNSLKSINVDTTSNNPKTIKLWFKRTVYSHAIGFGCDNLGKGFGNSITIKLLGSGEAVRATHNFTPSDPNSFLAQFGASAFNGVLIEFNTASEVCLSNLTIQKAVDTNSNLRGTTPLGVVKNVGLTEDGYLSVSNRSDGMAISEGDVAGKSTVHKFGAAPSFDTGTEVYVWDGSDSGNLAQYTIEESPTDNIDSLISSSGSDTEIIRVEGLDVSWNVVTQDITLNGQTRVPLSTNLLFVYRMENLGSNSLVGQVYAYTNNSTTSLGVPTDTSTVRAVIDDGNNQTEMAYYPVPAGKTAYLRKIDFSQAGANKATNYVFKFKVKQFGRQFNLKKRIAGTFTTPYSYEYIEPPVYPEKSILLLTCEATAGGVSGAAVSGGFDLVLKDN